MAVLRFDKNELGNLEYSLQREMLSTNRAGGYMSTTIVGCNTRKYHGLIVCPRADNDEENYVLLSSVDETVVQHEQEFNLAIHRFPGVYEPRGHKYITDFTYTPTPTITYRVGGVILKKELLWVHAHTQLLIRYTLLDARSETKLRLRPFLAFRNRHEMSHANLFADGHSYPIPGGVKSRLYEGFPWLNMQMNVPHEFVAAPDWYYNFEYAEEIRRGYPGHEDLLTTGYFEIAIKKGESVIFSGSTDPAKPEALERVFEEELARRSNKIDFLSCLRHSARQFIVRHGEKTEVVAGYPWFGRWGRDTFIALPGITLTQGGIESCCEVIDTMVREMKEGMFPNMGSAYNSVDAPLWFFWTLQCLEEHLNAKEIWHRYGKAMKEILENYRRGSAYVKVHENGLVWASHPQYAMTWMDAVVDGHPVTGRDGYQVEINALWYNAICYTLHLAKRFRDKAFLLAWSDMPERIQQHFLSMFWYARESFLADYVDQHGQNTFIRPNQIIACALPYGMLSDAMKLDVIEKVHRHLLTPKGLRTLSPRNPLYQGRYNGDQSTRDRAYHQGTVWPWLLEHYVKANFDIHGKAFLPEAEEILRNFEEEISVSGIASLNEIYEGDPPHNPRGAISQAWSVGAILRIEQMIQEYKRKRK
ncbi:MAG: amylo-alpha-1,6-glucosidase [Alistipes sp.]|nr:amylo-alpha-1,6-glucosidase [Alistipes sp.]